MSESYAKKNKKGYTKKGKNYSGKKNYDKHDMSDINKMVNQVVRSGIID